MSSFWRKVAALCVAAAAIAASVAIATAATGGNDNSSSKVTRGPLAPDREEHFSALAKELGVSTSDLREAFDAVREKLAPPERPSGRPSRAQLEKRCKEMTDALASELDKSGDEVRAAMKAVTKSEIEDAVKDKRLTQSQADKILDRLDDAACPPVFGPGLAVHCGPPHGARRGSDNGASVPAPPGGGPAIEFGPAA
jgi:hypothetical protein